jgi:hypothetical protein
VSGADQLTPARRDTLARLANELIPASGEMPSAGAVGVAGAGIDTVLASRPDLESPLLWALDAAANEEPSIAVRALEPSHFTALLVAVAGAYYMTAEVRRLIGYTGQLARPVESAGEPEDDLLLPVIRRGACYRNPDAGGGDG